MRARRDLVEILPGEVLWIRYRVVVDQGGTAWLIAKQSASESLHTINEGVSPLTALGVSDLHPGWLSRRTESSYRRCSLVYSCCRCSSLGWVRVGGRGWGRVPAVRLRRLLRRPGSPSPAAIIGEKTHGWRFLRLVRNMLTAGYLEDFRWGAVLSGAPRGRVALSILSVPGRQGFSARRSQPSVMKRRGCLPDAPTVRGHGNLHAQDSRGQVPLLGIENGCQAQNRNRYPNGTRVCFEARIERRDRKLLVVQFDGIPLQQQRKAKIADRRPIRVDCPQRELIARLLADTWEICGNKDHRRRETVMACDTCRDRTHSERPAGPYAR